MTDFVVEKLEIKKVKDQKINPQLLYLSTFKNGISIVGLVFLFTTLLPIQFLREGKIYIGTCTNLALFLFYDCNDLILYILFIDRDGPVAEKVLITTYSPNLF